MPYSYFNDKEQLVGLEIAYMYRLARSLNATLYFIPYEWGDFPENITHNKFDIMIGALYVIPQRLQYMLFSTPYYETKSSFLVKNEYLKNFSSYKDILKDSNLTIAIYGSSVLDSIAKTNFPNHNLVTIYKFSDFSNNETLAALISTYRITASYAISDDRYHSVIPTGLKNNPHIPIAFGINKHAISFERYVNMWLNMKETKSFAKQEKNYWFYYGDIGKAEYHRKPLLSKANK